MIRNCLCASKLEESNVNGIIKNTDRYQVYPLGGTNWCVSRDSAYNLVGPFCAQCTRYIQLKFTSAYPLKQNINTQKAG